MLKKRTQNKLLKKFIYIASGGFNFNTLLNFNTKVPLVAIWEESEDPTDEEIEIIYSRILKGAASIYYPHVIEGQKYTNFLSLLYKLTYQQIRVGEEESLENSSHIFYFYSFSIFVMGML
jgi:hypothetical protein